MSRITLQPSLRGTLVADEVGGPVADLLFGRAASVLSGALALVTAVACLAALAVPGAIRSPAATVGNMQGTALVLLVVTTPLLVISIVRVRAGHPAWILGWLGAAGSAAYQSVLFLFGTPFNPFFHLYVALLGLAVWTLVATAGRLPVAELEARIGANAPRRLVAGYLVVNAVLFGLLWLKATGPAVLGPMPPAFLDGTGMTTGPVQIIDFAFTLPAMLLAAWLLWRSRPWGRLLGGSLLVMLAIESTSIGVDQWMGSAADPTSPASSAALTPMFAVLTVIGLVVLALFLRPARER
ncbi:MAG TPA: hypothetical protein VF763_09590 [Candidatus Limnocylindrales bacterium]